MTNFCVKEIIYSSEDEFLTTLKLAQKYKIFKNGIEVKSNTTIIAL